jgi:uncharacterized membrane protein
MDDAFILVVILVSLLAFVVAAVLLATSGGSYDHVGRGGLSIGEDRPQARPSGGGAGSRADRDTEIRQLLDARNARRAARGEARVDVEAELAALTAPAADPELEAEVRALVEARNARRAARGEAPLDVDAEVSRRLREM